MTLTIKPKRCNCLYSIQMEVLRKLIVFMLITLTALPLQAQTIHSEKHDFKVETLLKNLDHPWGMDFLPGGEIILTEKPGNLYITNAQYNSTQTIAGLPKIKQKGQGGLLDVLVHPDFKSNKLIYLSYVNQEANRYGTEVLSAKLIGNRLEQVNTIFVALPKVRGGRHFGSRLAMDKEGFLFISLGDRGDKDKAQQLDSHIGSLIRLHDDGSIPVDNPFRETSGAKAEIYSYGHRNIQGMTIRPDDQSLWLHEHGPQGGDELNQSYAGVNLWLAGHYLWR